VKRSVRGPGARAMTAVVVLVFVTTAGTGFGRARAASLQPVREPTTVSAADVLTRLTGSDEMLESYAVPVHIDARLHKLFTFHFGLDGTVYYKRPDRVALDMHLIPTDYRRLFSQVGTPLTWPATFDLSVVSSTSMENGRVRYRLKGVPKRPGQVAYVLLDVDDVPGDPLHAQWFCRDGSYIDEHLTEQNSGIYELPKHAEADMVVMGYKVHATMDYGTYDVNQALADSLFVNA